MKLGSPVRRKHSRIEIIPLIDIMFFLLASFMMVSLSMDRTQNIKVNLPPATQAQHDFSPDMLNIAVDKAGEVWFAETARFLCRNSAWCSATASASIPICRSISAATATRCTARWSTSMKSSAAPGCRKWPSPWPARTAGSTKPMKLRSPLRRRRTRLEIIPLIDIMFFLLASFMMVSLQMQKVRTLKASLPTATLATSTAKPDMVTLTVDRNGQVAVDSKPISFPDLLTLLTKRHSLNTNLPVYITGTRDATHGSVMYVLDFVKRAGIQRVAIAVKAAPSHS